MDIKVWIIRRVNPEFTMPAKRSKKKLCYEEELIDPTTRNGDRRLEIEADPNLSPSSNDRAMSKNKANLPN